MSSANLLQSHNTDYCVFSIVQQHELKLLSVFYGHDFFFPQLLRWTVRNATSPVSFPLQLGRCHLQPLCTSCRLFCSSRIQTTPQSTQPSREVSPPPRQPLTGLSLRSLLDMGFTDTQAEQIFDAVSKVRGGSAAKNALSTLTALFVLGLNLSSVLKLLEKCPELYAVKELQLQQRIANLRKLGLVEGEVMSVALDGRT